MDLGVIIMKNSKFDTAFKKLDKYFSDVEPLLQEEWYDLVNGYQAQLNEAEHYKNMWFKFKEDLKSAVYGVEDSYHKENVEYLIRTYNDMCEYDNTSPIDDRDF